MSSLRRSYILDRGMVKFSVLKSVGTLHTKDLNSFFVTAMRNTEFISWLYGFFALTNQEDLTVSQRKIIHAHAKLLHSVEEGQLTVLNHLIWSSILDPEVLSFTYLQKAIAREYRRKPWPSSNELCYLLQGYFEICEDKKWRDRYTYDQADLIAREIRRNLDGLMPVLIALHRKLRDFTDDNRHSSKTAVLDASEIAESVNAAFAHVVDQSYGFSEEKNRELQAIHDEYKETQSGQGSA
jgi:hypothetical protein